MISDIPDVTKILLTIQGAQVQSLVRELDPACHKIKMKIEDLVCHN